MRLLRRVAAGLGLLLVAGAAARAHWLRPEEIIAGLKNDSQLHRTLGVADVRRDPKLPRLLIITVEREVWDAAPEADRIRLAEEWLETWRHNVPEGVVGVLDAATEESVVSFDAVGRARLKPRPPPDAAPRVVPGAPRSR